MIRKIVKTVVFIMFPLFFEAQGSGNTLTFNGVNQAVNIGNQVANGCRTMELWFKLDNNVTPTLANPITLIFRDFNAGSGLSTDEFGLFIRPAAWGANAGRINFVRRIGGTSFQIYSDANSWVQDHWYHVSAVIDPVLGMRMYVNGVLQAQTDPSVAPIGAQNTFATDNVGIGQWGNIAIRYFPGEIDEVRFWTTARSALEVRTNMCKRLTGAEPGLNGYYRFDSPAGAVLVDNTGNGFNGALLNMTNANWVLSGAPIGDTSSHLYSNNFTGQSLYLSSTPGDTLEVNNIFPNGQGIHIYKVNSLPNSMLGLSSSLTNSYYGVFMTDTNGPYDITYSYNTYGCDSCVSLSARNDNSILNWQSIPSISLVCKKQAINQSLISQDYRSEYILEKHDFNISLGNDTSICTGDSLVVKVTGGYDSYLWQDNSIDTFFIIKTPGVYFLEVDSSGCIAHDTIIVGVNNPTPISLGNDTTVCDGSIFSISPGVGFPNYKWQDNSIANSYQVSGTGQYYVVIDTLGCSSSDTITVTYINTPQFSLGNDTTICANATIMLTPGVYNAYKWQDNSTASSYIVNQSGVYHVTVNENTCPQSDTINIGILPVPAFSLGNDTVLLCGDELVLSPFNNPLINYNPIWNNGSTGNTFLVSDEGYYSVSILSSDGICSATDSIFVDYDCDLFVPNSFTPNGDDYNDVFGVVSLESFDNFELLIYNRWGRIVFESYDINNTWDGSHKNKSCPTGLYVWKLNYLKSGTKETKRNVRIGHVSLNK